MYQLEKKYLLKDSISTLIDDLQLDYDKITEFYTVVKVCKEIKFTKIGSSYYKKTKNGIIGSTHKKRVKIKKNNYKKMEQNSIGSKIKKRRYILVDNEERYSIDIFQKDLRGIYILEVTFKRRVDSTKYELPDIFKEYVIKEITNDKRYQDKNLALLGDPNKNRYNIYKIFKEIEFGRITELNNSILFKEMKTGDAIRIILYNLFIKLRINKDTIVATKADEGVDEFNHNLNKSLILLQEYREIFDKKLIKRVMTNLKNVKKVLKSYKDLQFIDKEINDLGFILKNNEIDRIHKNIDYKQSIEKHNIARFFTTREFSIIFKQYELILKENNRSFISTDAVISIEKSLNEKILKEYEKSLSLYEKYEGCEDYKSYKDMKKSLKKLSTLFQEYDIISGKKRFIPINKSIKKILRVISKIQSLDKKSTIIETYLSTFSKQSTFKHKKVEDIEKQNRKLLHKNIDLLHKNMEIFKKRGKLLK